jgi:hypothetical protein
MWWSVTTAAAVAVATTATAATYVRDDEHPVGAPEEQGDDADDDSGDRQPGAAFPGPEDPAPGRGPEHNPGQGPSPPSHRIEKISDQIAILLIRCVCGGAYEGPARVAGSDLDIVSPRFAVCERRYAASFLEIWRLPCFERLMLGEEFANTRTGFLGVLNTREPNPRGFRYRPSSENLATRIQLPPLRMHGVRFGRRLGGAGAGAIMPVAGPMPAVASRGHVCGEDEADQRAVRMC